MKSRIVTIAVVALLVGASAASFAQQDQPRYGGILTWFDYGDPARLDVHAESPLVVQQATAGVYSGLLHKDPDDPTKSFGSSGSATKAAPASCGVNPQNQAVRLLSVVPLLPATGRCSVAYTIGEVDHPSQLPFADPYPVTQRAASVAARATSWLTTRWQRGPATSLPRYLVLDPSGFRIARTGSGSQ